MNKDKLQVKLSLSSIYAQRCIYLAHCLYYRCMQASICHTLSILQHLSTAGIYIPPTYNSPPLCWPMRPIISYQAPHPHLPIPMSVLLLLVFVLTCVLLIPFLNPGLGYRAAEKPDPLLSSSPSRYLSVSLADYRVVLRLQWESKVYTLLRLDCQSRFDLFEVARNTAFVYQIKATFREFLQGFALQHSQILHAWKTSTIGAFFLITITQ